MIPIVRTSVAAALGCLLVQSAVAQEGTGLIDEIRLLKKTVEQQSRQIETLTQQVNRLAAALEGKSSPANPGPSTPAASPASGATEEFAAPAPGAKAEPGMPKHVVVKGETLTSIAKHYNITVADLQKANKDINDRKLQIGQTINLPPNVQPKNPEPTPTEKANP